MPVPDFSPGETLTSAAMDSIGMWLVKTQTVTGTPSSVAVPDAFSATYDHYRISISGWNNSIGSQLRFNLTGITTGYYFGTPLSASSGGAFASNSLSNVAFIDLGSTPATWVSDFVFDVMSPFKTTTTKVNGFGYNNSIFFGGLGSGVSSSTASSTGFTLTPSAGTVSGGVIRVYGYRN